MIPTAGGRAAILERSLRTLLDDHATEEVIVVVDRVDDPTQMLLQRTSEADPRLCIVTALGGADGLDRGHANRDAGVREAHGEVILALDDDVEPGAGLVAAHAERHERTQRLVLVGYMPVAPLTERRGAVQATARLYSENYERECRGFELSPNSILPRLWAGNLSLRREAWLEASGTEGIGAYHVDREFGLRLRQLGMQAAFDRQLRAVHHYRRTATELLDDALSSGIGRARLQMRWPELLAHESALAPNTGPRALLWRGRSRRRMRVVGLALATAAGGAALLGLSALETRFVRAIWGVGFGRGVFEAAGLLAGAER